MADRRRTLEVLIAAAVAPIFATRLSLAQDIAGGLIAPPAGTMQYTRTIARDLRDGQEIRCTRIFDVEFRRFDHGYMLHGAQRSARVEAPAPLAGLARLEEQRDESGLFPLALDALGRLLSHASDLQRMDEVSEALELAVAAIADQPSDRIDGQQRAILLGALHNASQGMTAHMPVDLFAPDTGQRHLTRAIPLPGGEEGVVETVFAGLRNLDTGLLDEATRTIVTRIGEDSRRTVETWALSGS